MTARPEATRTAHLFEGMSLPLSYASSLALTLACCRAGVIAGWQGGNVRTEAEFASILDAITRAETEAADAGRPFAPHAVNLPAFVVHDPELGAAKLKLCRKHRVPLVFSCLGDPSEIVRQAHDWGCIVIHDSTSVRHAEKALAAGVDGLMLTCAGAGGQSGDLSPFAFVPAVRRSFDGLLLVGGGIADAAGMTAALALGADIAVMGTRFIATAESGASEGHKAMIAASGIGDIVLSDRINGLAANWLRPSLERVGLDPDSLPEKRSPRQAGALPEGVRPWRDIWSAGHSAALIDEVAPVSALVARLAEDFSCSPYAAEWRERLSRRMDAIDA
ncbi:MAG: NAD(P)H-dependent flavin oxidoreductase [Caulobacterales bacterium]